MTHTKSPPLMKKEFACGWHCIFSANSFAEMGSPEAFTVCSKAVSPPSGRLTLQLSLRGSGSASVLTASWEIVSKCTKQVSIAAKGVYPRGCKFCLVLSSVSMCPESPSSFCPRSFRGLVSDGSRACGRLNTQDYVHPWSALRSAPIRLMD